MVPRASARGLKGNLVKVRGCPAAVSENEVNDRLWVNPDCGLKTRGWPDVKAALSIMVEAARRTRLRGRARE